MLYYDGTDVLKELMIIRQGNQKSAIFAIWYFLFFK